MPHDEVQEFLRARYYIPVSQLYSVIRPDKHRSGFDVAVEGDWVTIAVVAERGTTQVTKSINSSHGGGDEEVEEEKDNSKSTTTSWRDIKKKQGNGPKKYVRMTLVDFGQNSSAGDALLNLLLWEADVVSEPPKDPDGKSRGATVYRGGSGGAFEECAHRLREGAVIAILNPRVLRPQQARVLSLPYVNL